MESKNLYHVQCVCGRVLRTSNFFIQFGRYCFLKVSINAEKKITVSFMLQFSVGIYKTIDILIETEWWKEDYLAEKTSQLHLDIYFD